MKYIYILLISIFFFSGCGSDSTTSTDCPPPVACPECPEIPECPTCPECPTPQGEWVQINRMYTTADDTYYAVHNDGTLWGGTGPQLPSYQVGTANDWKKISPYGYTGLGTLYYGIKKDGSFWYGIDIPESGRTEAQIGIDTDWIEVEVANSYIVNLIKNDGTLWYYNRIVQEINPMQ